MLTNLPVPYDLCVADPISRGEGPSRGLLRDYEPSDGTFSSTNIYQDLYLGNSAQNCYEDEEAGELPPLRLESRHLEAVAALRNLATLELEAAAADTVEAVLLRLAEAGSR